jgi:hypothetical protein
MQLFAALEFALSAGSKAVLFFCICLVGVMLIYRGNQAMDPALPKDMPTNSRFIATGYDLAHNERKGTWVACQPDGNGITFCRVTDAHGIVIFQGDYVPVRDSRSVADGGAQNGSASSTLKWVQGPFEGAPVPMIPMSDGSWLVPLTDRDALVDRWNRNPDEWQKLMTHE